MSAPDEGEFAADEVARLRRALGREADMVQPSGDGLERIRERTGRPWWRSPATAVSAAVVAVLAAGAVGIGIGSLAGRGDDSSGGADPVVGGAVEVTTQPAVPPKAVDQPTPQETTPAPSKGTVPVYYVKDDGGTPRLYREFHQVSPGSGDGALVVAALEQMAGTPQDPDYRSLWKGVTVTSYARSGPTATVELSGQNSEGIVEGDEVNLDAALQEVVYTVTAVEQDASLSLRILVDGQLLGDGVRREEESDVVGLVWLTAPEQGASVSGTVHLKGVASVFEATVGWDAMQDGKVVKSGFATASEPGPGRGTWSADVRLPPGHYVLRAFAPDESGQDAEGIVAEDTKSVVVK